MTLTQIHYVITIAETKSMNKAAELLYVAQPSLTNAIKELEKELGITLFFRSGKGVTLTNDGAYVQMYAERIQILANKIKADAKVYAEETVDSDMKGKIA